MSAHQRKHRIRGFFDHMKERMHPNANKQEKFTSTPTTRVITETDMKSSPLGYTTSGSPTPSVFDTGFSRSEEYLNNPTLSSNTYTTVTTSDQMPTIAYSSPSTVEPLSINNLPEIELPSRKSFAMPVETVYNKEYEEDAQREILDGFSFSSCSTDHSQDIVQEPAIVPSIQEQNSIAGQDPPFAFSDKDLPAGLRRTVVTLENLNADEELLNNTQLTDSELETSVVQSACQLVEDDMFTEEIGRESVSDGIISRSPEPVANDIPNPITDPTSEPVSVRGDTLIDRDPTELQSPLEPRQNYSYDIQSDQTTPLQSETFTTVAEPVFLRKNVFEYTTLDQPNLMNANPTERTRELELQPTLPEEEYLRESEKIGDFKERKKQEIMNDIGYDYATSGELESKVIESMNLKDKLCLDIIKTADEHAAESQSDSPQSMKIIPTNNQQHITAQQRMHNWFSVLLRFVLLPVWLWLVKPFMLTAEKIKPVFNKYWPSRRTTVQRDTNNQITADNVKKSS